MSDLYQNINNKSDRIIEPFFIFLSYYKRLVEFVLWTQVIDSDNNSNLLNDPYVNRMNNVALAIEARDAG